MTDRIKDLHVVLDNDYREDDAKLIIDAIIMLKGVDSVRLGAPVRGSDYAERQRLANEFDREINKAINRMRKGESIRETDY